MNTNQTSKDLFNEAVSAFVEEQFDTSIEFLTRSLEIDPDFTLAVITRGTAFFKQEKYQEALEDFDRAIKLDPHHAGAFYKKGLVLEKLGNFEDAIRELDQAIALDPEYGAAFYSRATLHAKLSNANAAQEDMQMITHLGNRNLETYMNDNNVWHTQHMRVEDVMETELNR
ncbi:MAG: tetratricopeptide repeat protein [Desulfobacterales bacterium]|nr:tetratricopeptide repeat protein [Desulfobacterales bacterium]